MELQEIVQRIITLNIANEKDIAIVGDKEHSNVIPNLKYIAFKDIPLIKDNAFKAVIIKDPRILKKGKLEDVFRISKKYVLLADPSYLGAIKKTEDFIENVSEGGFGQIYRKLAEGKNNYVSSISKEIEKLETKPELTIIAKNGEIMNNLSSAARKERGDADRGVNTDIDGDFLFNFALIQNLKKQIVEKEKITVDKTKEIEILKKDIDVFKKNIESLMETIKNVRTTKNKEIKDLEKRLKRELEDKKRTEITFFKKLKKKEDEIENLRDGYNEELDKKKAKMADIRRRMESEIEEIEAELESIKKDPIYKLLSKIKLGKFKSTTGSRKKHAEGDEE